MLRSQVSQPSSADNADRSSTPAHGTAQQHPEALGGPVGKLDARDQPLLGTLSGSTSLQVAHST